MVLEGLVMVPLPHSRFHDCRKIRAVHSGYLGLGNINLVLNGKHINPVRNGKNINPVRNSKNINLLRNGKNINLLRNFKNITIAKT